MRMRFIRGNNQRPPLTPRQQTLAFWGIVLGVCLCCGAASFAAGHYYLAKKLRDVEARTPKNAFPGKGVADSDKPGGAKPDSAKSDPDAVTAPEKAIVRIEAREPNPGEKSDADEEHAKKSPKSKHGDEEGKSATEDSGKSDSSGGVDKADVLPRGDDEGAKGKKSKVVEGGPIE